MKPFDTTVTSFWPSMEKDWMEGCATGDPYYNPNFTLEKKTLVSKYQLIGGPKRLPLVLGNW